jgi:hypothetical protein
MIRLFLHQISDVFALQQGRAPGTIIDRKRAGSLPAV